MAISVDAHLGMDQAHAAHLALLAEQGQRLAMEQEADAFLAAVADLPARDGHAGLVAPAHAGDRGGDAAHRGPADVHAGITPADNEELIAAAVARRPPRLTVAQKGAV